jgi:hypothetical protein
MLMAAAFAALATSLAGHSVSASQSSHPVASAETSCSGGEPERGGLPIHEEDACPFCQAGNASLALGATIHSHLPCLDAGDHAVSSPPLAARSPDSSTEVARAPPIGLIR